MFGNLFKKRQDDEKPKDTFLNILLYKKVNIKPCTRAKEY